MITVDRKQFTRAIDLAGRVIERRNTIPALGALKIVANGALVLEGSDLDATTRVEMPYAAGAKKPKGEAEFCLPDAHRLRAALGHAGGEQIELTPDAAEKQVAVASGAFAGELRTLPGDDHPGFEPVDQEEFACDIGAAELGQIARLLPAISTEETRYYLNGIAVWKVGDWLYRFASTDGHRLMTIDVPLPGATGLLPDDKIIIPKRWLTKALATFPKAKDGARFSFGFRNPPNSADKDLAPVKRGIPRVALAADLDGLRFTLATKLIDGTYPDVMRVFPSDPPHRATVACSDLIQAINTLTPFGSDKIRAIRLMFAKGEITCALKSYDLGDSRFTIGAEHDLPKDFSIGFNGQYLLDCLASLRGDEVTLGLTSPGAPTLIEDPADTAFRAVLMPMRV